MSLKSNQGKIPEFTMVNILNSVKRSYKINKAPEKQLKKGKENTKQTNKTKKKEMNHPKKTIKANQRHKQLKQNKATNCELKVNGATLHKWIHL